MKKAFGFGLLAAAVLTFGLGMSPISAQVTTPTPQRNVTQFSATNVSTHRFALRNDTTKALSESAKWENVGKNFSAYRYNKTKLRCAQGTKLFEFRSKTNGSFYYESDPAIAKIIKRNADFKFMGIPFCIDRTEVEGGIGMYQLVRFDNPVYYFTTSQEDVDAKVASGEWFNGGITFYVKAAL
jgi:hypothetical protein